MGRCLGAVMLHKEQTTLDLPEPQASLWLGLASDNRRLFEGLQDGWLRPLPSRTGSLVGVNSYRREHQEVDGNRIPVRIQIELAKLPNLKVVAFRNNKWRYITLSQVAATDAAVFWPGVLPLISVCNLTVSSDEQRVRLLSIGKRISNIEVPDVSVDSDNVEATRLPVPPPEVEAELVIPAEEDSIRGAMSMALWAVPRIDPWMRVLTASLSPQSKGLRKHADVVDASWWRFPPWAPTNDARPNDAQEGLWLAALRVLGSNDCPRPGEAADRIAAMALHGCTADDAGIVEAWCLATQRVLRAEAAIQFADWRDRPVELAIQLVLSRPEPAAFKTWFVDDHVNLPPAVAWSAAALCGLYRGYRRLDTHFRGKQVQREVVAVQALRMCSGGTPVSWPYVSEDPPEWRKETGNFVLSWGGWEFARKHQQERGKWYATDLGIDAVQREALALAKERGWPCLSRVISFKEGARPITGPGMVEIDKRVMTVRGDVRIGLLPGDTVEELIDGDAFRHLVAVEPGRLLVPPSSEGHVKSNEETQGIPGLKRVRDFLTEAEEREILAEIDTNDWSNELQRRVQHYGWRYDYKSRQVDPSMRIGPLPDWANRVAQRLVDEGHVGILPDQVIVNAYRESQGIAPHIDSESSFADGVAMISLLETWEMVFKKRRGREKVTHKLERRSATILTGEARYGWTHAIPKRKSEPGAVKPGNKRPSRIPRDRRVSLTFRKVVATIMQPVDA